ncbi:MAG: TIGR03792 family protein [Longicatena sp.]
MKIIEYKNKHFPIEYLIFNCRNEAEAKLYIEKNEIWTDALSKKEGFISTSSYINKKNPGEVHIQIIWETLEQWLAIPKEDLVKIANEFDKAFGLPYKSGRRIHNENNFGYHLVQHYEIRR